MSNKSRFSDIDEVKTFLDLKESKILAIIDKNGNEEEFNRVPTANEKVKWLCAANETHISFSAFKHLYNNTKEQILCRACSISASRGGPTYDTFAKQLSKEGWTMIDSRDKYKNNKSMMRVRCDSGHETETSQNRFSSGHRCKECANGNMRKHSVEDIRLEFEEKGFKLLETKYINNTTNMKYICKCGREGYITYSNFTKNIDGCKKCTRRWTVSDVQEFMIDNGCELLNPLDEEFILNATNITYICICNDEYTSTWKMFKKGCRCIECTKESIRQTCLEKYGVDNPSKSEEIKQKIVDVMRERFGVDYIMQLGEYREKAIATNKKNHDGIHNLNTPEMRKKSKDAYEGRYGAPFGHVEEHREKAKQVTLERYNSMYFIGTNHFYSKMIEKYGVKHALQNPEIFHKMIKSSFSTKWYSAPSEKLFQIQGYENYALRDLFEYYEIDEDDVVTGKQVPVISYIDGNTERKYYPDIYVKSENLLIEVKSPWTYIKDYDKNIKKFQAASKEYRFLLWIYNDKGELVEERSFTNSSLNFIY